MPGSTLSLGDVAARTEALEVACSRCDRRGRYPVVNLIRRYGAAIDLPSLLRLLSADCPEHGTVGQYARCGAHYPGLPALFGVARQQ